MNDLKELIKYTWSNMDKKKQIAVGVVVLVLIVAGWDYSGDQIKEYRSERRRKRNADSYEKPKKEKKPNIIWEYLKAKKRKICHIIEWED